MTIQYIVRVKSDPANRRWAVLEAVSLKAAFDAITHARVLGSVGASDFIHPIGEPEKALAIVHQINSDGTLRQPYTEAY